MQFIKIEILLSQVHIFSSRNREIILPIGYIESTDRRDINKKSDRRAIRIRRTHILKL